MNQIELRKAGTVRLIGIAQASGLFVIAVLVSIAELTILNYLMAMTAMYIGIPIHQLIVLIRNTIGDNTIAGILAIFPVIFLILCVLAVPVLVAAFNSYKLVNIAGRHKGLFAKQLAVGSIVWAVVGLGLTFTMIKGGFSSISLIVPLSLVLGCLCQFWFAFRVARRAKTEQPAAQVNYANITPQLSAKIASMADATTSSELEILAAECLSLMEVKQLSIDTPQNSVHVLIDCLVKAKMPIEADAVSSKMIHFLEVE